MELLSQKQSNEGVQKGISFEEFLSYIHPEEYKLWGDVMEVTDGILIDMKVLQGAINPAHWDKFVATGMQKATGETYVHPFMKKTVRMYDSPMFYRMNIKAQDHTKSISADLVYVPEHSPILPIVIHTLNVMDYYEALGMGINLEDIHSENEYTSYL